MNRNVLITGASRGIGAAAAEAFAADGCSLTLTGLNSQELLKERKDCLERDYHVPVKIFTGDMGDFDTVKRLFDLAGDTDILVNNCGSSYTGLLQDMDILEWNRVIGDNLTSVFNCCRFAIPGMVRRQQGKIINVSSVWGSSGASMEAAYSAAKGGVDALTKALAKELAPSNIQVNAIACGLIDTRMNACYTREELSDIVSDIPAGRMGTPEDAAQTILSLSRASSYLTGQIIRLDGGWL